MARYGGRTLKSYFTRLEGTRVGEDEATTQHLIKLDMGRLRNALSDVQTGVIEAYYMALYKLVPGTEYTY